MTTSPLLSRPGAVALEHAGGFVAEPADTPAAAHSADTPAVAAHYGDPLPEQRLLAEGAGLVDRGNRDVLVVPGADRLSWLHSLTSQHLERLADGTGTEALVLSPNGHVEHHLVLADLAGTTWIDVEPGTGAELLAFLERMRFMMRVEPALVTEQWAVLSLVGPSAATVLESAQLPAPSDPYGVVAAGTGFVRRMPPIGDGAPVFDVLVARAETADLADRLLAAGARLAGVHAYEALRVEARRPRLGVDSDHRTIPNELEWLHTAVHLDKGCYRGQETVARVDNLGRPPRRLVLLHLDGVSERLPAPGDPLLAGTRTIGRLGTVVRHHELGAIALALVKRSADLAVALKVGDTVAAVDPDDAVDTSTGNTAVRERVRAIRSATIGR